MHLLIKCANQSTKAHYIHHTHFHEGDAGFDIYSPEDIVVKAKTIGQKVDLKISCQALRTKNSDKNDPKQSMSYYMYARSSIGNTPLRLANSVGIIDRGYRGHLIGCFDNVSDEDFVIKKGTRLLQICRPDLEPEISFELVDELSDTSRGSGGYGSTGN